MKGRENSESWQKIIAEELFYCKYGETKMNYEKLWPVA